MAAVEESFPSNVISITDKRVLRLLMQKWKSDGSLRRDMPEGVFLDGGGLFNFDSLTITNALAMMTNNYDGSNYNGLDDEDFG